MEKETYIPGSHRAYPVQRRSSSQQPLFQNLNPLRNPLRNLRFMPNQPPVPQNRKEEKKPTFKSAAALTSIPIRNLPTSRNRPFPSPPFILF